MRITKDTLLDYSKIMSGVVGRLLISVIYFLIVANGLTLGDFGIFAAASATGLVLSRLLAFGFISPVYRVATTRPRVLGVYVAGLGLWTVLSLPLLIILAALIYALGFSSKISPLLFAGILIAEVLGWRIVEYVAIILNGLNRFGATAQLVIIGQVMRTIAAIAFLMIGGGSLALWVWLYVAANVISLAVALLGYAPSLRLRLKPKLYLGRARDAVTAALSEMVFYVQSELDKLLVLGLAGDRTAGMYAIAMRLIDLTAIPVRTFNQMFVQKLMRDGLSVQAQTGFRQNALIEIAIAAVSTAGLLAFIVLLWMYPTILGKNVAAIAPYLPLMLVVPALRNLIEYQAELLYAREIVITRTVALTLLAAVKLGLMAILLQQSPAFAGFTPWLNGIFVVLYLISAAIAYPALRRNSR